MTPRTGTPELLVKVLERTREGKLTWELTRSKSYLVRIASLRAEVIDPDRPPFRGEAQFIVYDSDGSELDSITTKTDGGFWNVELLELVRLARLSARGASGKYAAALEALDRTG